MRSSAQFERRRSIRTELTEGRAELTETRTELTKGRAELTETRTELTEGRAELTETGPS